MRHQDFGHFDEPIVLFGGPYSNLQALQALIQTIDGTHAVCTGDIVGYCAEPNETIDLFFAQDFAAVAGNCERQLFDGRDDCGCGFEDGSTCDRLSAGWWPWLVRTAGPAEITRLNALPDIGSFLHQGRRYAVIHGGATAINRFIWPSSPEAVFREEIAAIESVIGPFDGVVAGHSGIAFQRRLGRYHWINAGAVGLPPHDGRPATRYAMLENGEAMFHRLDYDHETASQRMIDAGLVQGYQDSLRTGIWPSEDMLPPELRRAAYSFAKGW